MSSVQFCNILMNIGSYNRDLRVRSGTSVLPSSRQCHKQLASVQVPDAHLFSFVKGLL